MTRRSKLWVSAVALFGAAFPISPCPAQDSGNAARIVVWQPKPGMSRDLEEGYKRHLEWHRKNKDQWTWYGWSIITGEHDGYFVDGTFFRTWKELDSPVAPAADGADAETNVVSYGDVRSAGIYQTVPELTDLGPQQLTSPWLTFCYLDVQVGRGAEFESLMRDGLQQVHGGTVKYAVLRPVNGVNEYLLVLPGEKTSDLATQADFTAHLLEVIARNVKGGDLVHHYRTETARYRPDLSFSPSENSK